MPYRIRPHFRLLRIAAIAAAAIVIAALLPPGSSGANAVEVSQDACRESSRSSRDRFQYCEVRGFEFPLPASGLRVEGGVNGSVQVLGSDRSTVLIEAQVQTSAKTAAEAQQIAENVVLQFPVSGGVLSSSGPEQRNGRGWAVSYRIFVPRKADVEVKAHNGGITLRDVDGRLRFEAVNGGVDLHAVAGDVEGRSTNGGLTIDLDGNSWSGKGLDARTTNGGVEVKAPAHYNAEFTASTVNGNIRFDLPSSPTKASLKGSLTTTLGSGGPPIRVATTNGSVRIVER